MTRIANVTLPANKRIVIALTYIYGIGITNSNKLCAEVKIDHNKKVKDLTESELTLMRNFIEKNYVVEGDLKRVALMNIKLKRDIKCYQGLRHIRGLPVRGQNTHSNAQTSKKRKK